MMCRQVIVLLLLLDVSFSLQIESDVSLPPRIPIFFGVGYNILVGNPFTNKVDPGFSHNIFDFTFTKGGETEDGKFLVPDGVHQVKTTSCSFSSSVSQYRGTQSYQNQLKTKVSIEGGYKGALFQASFSGSTSYQKINNETIGKQSTITHAFAECQFYKLSIDLFNSQKLSANFISGVIASYHSKNWDSFISQFGSHFVYQVIMGGRAIQQTTYSHTTIQKLQSLQIDVNIVAKASFAKFYASSSYDWQKYQQSIKYAQSLEQTKNEIYIGGHPSPNSTIAQWQQKVIDQLAPIYYKMLPISDLFDKIVNSTFNASAAKGQFLTYLDKYCASKGCSQPSADRPKPPPAINSLATSQQLGGNGGGAFSWAENSTTLDLKKVLIRSGKEVDKLQLMLGDGIRSLFTSAQGGDGGSPHEWLVPDGQQVTQVEYRSGDRVDALTFITDKGVKSPTFGGGGGSYHLVTFPQGYRIIGFFGRSGSRLDGLGFHLAKTIYPSTSPTLQQ